MIDPENIKVLVVEDEMVVQMDIEDTVESLGYTVVGTTDNGEEAIQMARELEPDVILMDVRINGELDGISTAEKIREKQDIPVIYLTANTNFSTVERAKVTGPYAYIIKPFEKRELNINLSIAVNVHRLNKQLKEQKHQLEVITDNIQDFLWMKDLESRKLIYVNDAVNRLFGVSKEEMLGRENGWFDFISEKDKGRVISLHTEGPYPIDVEYSVEVGDKQAWIRERIIESEQADGKKILVGIATDVTNTKQVKKLEQENILAHEKDRLKDQFMANMSHEIRTPLNAIIGFTRSLKEMGIEGQANKYIEYIRKSGEHLLEIVNQILDFSKLKSGKLNFEKVDFDFCELLNSLTEGLKSKAEERGNQLSSDIAEELPKYICGDPTRLRQILMNLVSNAIKFTHNGVITIVAELAEDGMLRIKVVDTGIGISEEKQKRIFESFEQERSDTTRKYGGTGLGLSITRELVISQGGKIYVKSKVDKGSEFVFEVPFKPGEEPELPDENYQYSYSASRPLNILIVEDNHFNRLVLGESLNKWGIPVRIQEATNGEEALKLLAEDKNIDLIFMDMQMPVMDGYEATMELRKSTSEYLRNVPIIAITAHTQESERKKCLGMGMNDYISKPFLPDELYEKTFYQLPAGIVGRVRINRAPQTKDLLFRMRKYFSNSQVIASKLNHFLKSFELKIERLDVNAKSPKIARAVTWFKNYMFLLNERDIYAELCIAEHQISMDLVPDNIHRCVTMLNVYWKNHNELLKEQMQSLLQEEITFEQEGGDGKVTNLTFLNQVAKGDKKFKIQQIEVFKNSVPFESQEIDEFIKNKEAEKVRARVHKMKPMLGFMGMNNAVRISEWIEGQVKSGSGVTDEMQEKWGTLKDICFRAIEELEGVLQELQ